jgi:hypothetical protein
VVCDADEAVTAMTEHLEDLRLRYRDRLRSRDTKEMN